MVLMGVATMAIGLVPSYDQIGVWGAVFLSVGRVMQGMAVGGEWSGSVLMAGEWTDPKRRGFTTSFAQFGAPAGLVLANGALALMSAGMSEASFLAWGWRVPFLASVVLVFVGLYIRLGVLETPVFADLKARGTLAKAPLVDTLRSHWREVLLATLLRPGQVVPFYIFTTYIITYTTQQLGYSRAMVLNFVMIQSVLSMAVIPLMGYLSDTLGRRRVIGFGCVVMMMFPFLHFWMVDTGSLALGLVAIALGLPIHDIQYGPQAAIIAEAFPASLRYSGSSLGYQLASITAGGPAPIVALLLFREFQTAMAIAAFMAGCALISLAALWALPRRSGDLDTK